MAQLLCCSCPDSLLLQIIRKLRSEGYIEEQEIQSVVEPMAPHAGRLGRRVMVLGKSGAVAENRDTERQMDSERVPIRQ